MTYRPPAPRVWPQRRRPAPAPGYTPPPDGSPWHGRGPVPETYRHVVLYSRVPTRSPWVSSPLVSLMRHRTLQRTDACACCYESRPALPLSVAEMQLAYLMPCLCARYGPM